MAIKNPELIAATAGERIVQKFTGTLRNMAYDAGWPEEIVSSMSLVYDGSAVQISYPERYTSVVNDLEFGKEGQPPNSVIRSFMLRYQNKASEELAYLVAEDIHAYGGVL